MASFYISETGQLLDVAKRAALDAVAGYTNVTPYTIGIAVQAAVDVLQAGKRFGLSTIEEPEPLAPAGRPSSIDVGAVEVTPRLRALESVARAAAATHGPHAVDADCVLCSALVQLEDLDAAS